MKPLQNKAVSDILNAALKKRSTLHNPWAIIGQMLIF
jgi:hypothetical protein